jgi:hypothetical protein
VSSGNPLDSLQFLVVAIEPPGESGGLVTSED